MVQWLRPNYPYAEPRFDLWFRNMPEMFLLGTYVVAQLESPGLCNKSGYGLTVLTISKE